MVKISIKNGQDWILYTILKFKITVDVEKIGDDDNLLFFHPTPSPKSPTPGK